MKTFALCFFPIFFIINIFCIFVGLKSVTKKINSISWLLTLSVLYFLFLIFLIPEDFYRVVLVKLYEVGDEVLSISFIKDKVNLFFLVITVISYIVFCYIKRERTFFENLILNILYLFVLIYFLIDNYFLASGLFFSITLISRVYYSYNDKGTASHSYLLFFEVFSFFMIWFSLLSFYGSAPSLYYLTKINNLTSLNDHSLAFLGALLLIVGVLIKIGIVFCYFEGRELILKRSPDVLISFITNIVVPSYLLYRVAPFFDVFNIEIVYYVIVLVSCLFLFTVFHKTEHRFSSLVMFLLYVGIFNFLLLILLRMYSFSIFMLFMVLMNLIQFMLVYYITDYSEISYEIIPGLKKKHPLLLVLIGSSIVLSPSVPILISFYQNIVLLEQLKQVGITYYFYAFSLVLLFYKVLVPLVIIFYGNNKKELTTFKITDEKEVLFLPLSIIYIFIPLVSLLSFFIIKVNLFSGNILDHSFGYHVNNLLLYGVVVLLLFILIALLIYITITRSLKTRVRLQGASLGGMIDDSERLLPKKRWLFYITGNVLDFLESVILYVVKFSFLLLKGVEQGANKFNVFMLSLIAGAHWLELFYSIIVFDFISAIYLFFY